jgi:hypothetical protein
MPPHPLRRLQGFIFGPTAEKRPVSYATRSTSVLTGLKSNVYTKIVSHEISFQKDFRLQGWRRALLLFEDEKQRSPAEASTWLPVERPWMAATF